MGHGIRHKKRKDNPRKRDDRDQRGSGYKDIIRENEWLETFYRSQDGLCPPEEFNEMIKFMKEDLPASFRITGIKVLTSTKDPRSWRANYLSTNL